VTLPLVITALTPRGYCKERFW